MTKLHDAEVYYSSNRGWSARTAVPSGWIYVDRTSGSALHCFVPDPTAPHAVVVRAQNALAMMEPDGGSWSVTELADLMGSDAEAMFALRKMGAEIIPGERPAYERGPARLRFKLAPSAEEAK